MKPVENYHDFENLVHVIQHGLFKNIESESTEANDLSHHSRRGSFA